MVDLDYLFIKLNTMGLFGSKPAPVQPQVDVAAQLRQKLADTAAAEDLISQGIKAQIAQLNTAPAAPPPVQGRSWGTWFLLMLLGLAAIFGAAVGIYYAVSGKWLWNAVEPFGQRETFGTRDATKACEADAKNSTCETFDVQYGDVLPRSINADSGLEFGYSWWMAVDDWSVGYGKKKHVFTKGDESKGEQCPAVYLSASENAMELVFDTYKNQDETILIPNLPAKKWFHTAISVHDEDIVDIYINGKLKKSHKLNGIVQQNKSKMFITQNGGYAGKIANLKYYPNRLSEDDVQKLATELPSDTVTTHTTASYDKPPYFATSWWGAS